VRSWAIFIQLEWFHLAICIGQVIEQTRRGATISAPLLTPAAIKPSSTFSVQTVLPLPGDTNNADDFRCRHQSIIDGWYGNGLNS
jgi:hypothetical protein